MASFVPSGFPAQKAKTRRYSTQEWEVQKINVERLYIGENRPLKEVMQILKDDFGFIARYDRSIIFRLESKSLICTQ
jgi:hypothetical protein